MTMMQTPAMMKDTSKDDDVSNNSKHVSNKRSLDLKNEVDMDTPDPKLKKAKQDHDNNNNDKNKLSTTSQSHKQDKKETETTLPPDTTNPLPVATATVTESLGAPKEEAKAYEKKNVEKKEEEASNANTKAKVTTKVNAKAKTATSTATEAETDTNDRVSKDELIDKPSDLDILSGRGKYVNYHPGNVQFRRLIAQHKIAYVTCPKPEKSRVADQIVSQLNATGARFLKQVEGAWHVLPHRTALLKTRQALREGAPELSEQLTQTTTSTTNMTTTTTNPRSSTTNTLRSTNTTTTTTTATTAPATVAPPLRTTIDPNKNTGPWMPTMNRPLWAASSLAAPLPRGGTLPFPPIPYGSYPRMAMPMNMMNPAASMMIMNATTMPMSMPPHNHRASMWPTSTFDALTTPHSPPPTQRSWAASLAAPLQPPRPPTTVDRVHTNTQVAEKK